MRLVSTIISRKHTNQLASGQFAFLFAHDATSAEHCETFPPARKCLRSPFKSQSRGAAGLRVPLELLAGPAHLCRGRRSIKCAGS